MMGAGVYAASENGFFHDQKDMFGTVTGLTYENATAEIGVSAVYADDNVNVRTCPHRVNVRIFRHNFVGGKAKIRRRAVALQGFLTLSPAKFDEKTCMNPYMNRFSNEALRYACTSIFQGCLLLLTSPCR